MRVAAAAVSADLDDDTATAVATRDVTSRFRSDLLTLNDRVVKIIITIMMIYVIKKSQLNSHLNSHI